MPRAFQIVSVGSPAPPPTFPPGPPTGIIPTPVGPTCVSVAFTAPDDDGGCDITEYCVTASPGGLTACGASSPIVVCGLTPGQPYTFTVTATNCEGPGDSSVPSPPSPPPPALPTDPALADALAGRRGAVNIGYRFEQRDHNFLFQNDLSAAIQRASIDLDNDRVTVRTARFTIDALAMPEGFDPVEDHIAISAVVSVPTYLGSGYWEIQQQVVEMGLYHLDAPQRVYEDNGRELWEVEASDLTVHLLTAKTPRPYAVASGANVIESVRAVFDLLALQHSFAASAEVTPVDLAWAPGTPYGQIVNDLLFSINYYPAWPNGRGVFISRYRFDPAIENPAVDYTTDAEPRMVMSPFTKLLDHSRFANRVVVVIDDPRRTAEYALRVNNDPSSPISIARLGVTNADPPISGGRVVDLSTAAEIVDFELKDRAARAERGTLNTFADPRRAPHEFYRLSIAGVESVTQWRVDSWRLALEPGAVMEHGIGFARAIETSIVVALSGTILTATAADIVAGGVTLLFDLPGGYLWAAAGVAFDAERQGILDGLRSSGDEATGWNAAVVPALSVGDVVRTSATRVTVTLPATGSYAITLPETVHATIPPTALDGSQENFTEPDATIIP